MGGDFLETMWVKFIESDFSGIVDIFGDLNIVLLGEGLKVNFGGSFFYFVCPYFLRGCFFLHKYSGIVIQNIWGIYLSIV